MRPIASSNPINGESAIKRIILLTPATWTTPHPPLTTPAPISPPTKACDELVGRPNHQVMISHVIAPIRVERRSQAVTIAGSIVPFPIVDATFTPNAKAATKLKKAAHRTAIRGDSFVENNISFVFQPVNLDDPTLDFGRLDFVNTCKRKVDLLNRLNHEFGESPHRLSRRADLIKVETVYGCVDVV